MRVRRIYQQSEGKTLGTGTLAGPPWSRLQSQSLNSNIAEYSLRARAPRLTAPQAILTLPRAETAGLAITLLLALHSLAVIGAPECRVSVFVNVCDPQKASYQSLGGLTDIHLGFQSDSRYSYFYKMINKQQINAEKVGSLVVPCLCLLYGCSQVRGESGSWLILPQLFTVPISVRSSLHFVSIL